MSGWVFGLGQVVGLTLAFKPQLVLTWILITLSSYQRSTFEKVIIDKEKFKFAGGGLIGFHWCTDVGFDEPGQNPVFWNVTLFYSYHHQYFTVSLNQEYYNDRTCFGLKNSIGIMFGKETLFFVDYSFGITNCDYGPSSIPSLRFAIGI